jgi:hypothetical protein
MNILLAHKRKDHVLEFGNLSVIACISDLVAMALKISFVKNKKWKTEEQLRRERSSARANPDHIPELSFYPTSSDPTKQNPTAGGSSSQPRP